MITAIVPRSARNQGGFTLIELLTVIAIIGILAAILIPVVAQVRESGRRAQCGSNIRQIALAVLSYESEMGHLPGPTEREVQSPALGRQRRGANIPKSEWRNHNIDLSLIIEDYLGTTYHDGDHGIFYCPSNLELAKGDPRVLMFLIMRNIRTNPRSFFGDMDFNQQPRSLEQIVAAGTGMRSRVATELTQIWMISDIDGGNYGSAAGTGGDAPLTRQPGHDGGRNYAFFDGHLEFVKPDGDGMWRYPASTGDPGNHGT